MQNEYEHGLFLDIAIPGDEDDVVPPPLHDSLTLPSLEFPSTTSDSSAVLFYMKPVAGRVETSSRKVFALYSPRD
jgi:hypothetical protein